MSLVFENPVQHRRHHFISSHLEKDEISLEFVPTDKQLADSFTKLINKEQFNFIKRNQSLAC